MFGPLTFETKMTSENVILTMRIQYSVYLTYMDRKNDATVYIYIY